MIDILEALPAAKAGNYLSGQLVPSFHSPAFSFEKRKVQRSVKDFFAPSGSYSKRAFGMLSWNKDYYKKGDDKTSWKIVWCVCIDWRTDSGNYKKVMLLQHQ